MLRIRIDLCLVAIALASPLAYSASLQSYAFSVAGVSSCGTYGPSPTVQSTITANVVSVSTPGPGCGVTQSEQSFTGASGYISATSSAAGGGNNINGIGNSTSSSASWVDFMGGAVGAMNMGVSSSDSFLGVTASNAVSGGEAFALLQRSWTAPAGATYLRFSYALDGTQIYHGNGIEELTLIEQKNNDPQFEVFRSRYASGSGPPSISVNSQYVNSYPGITVTTSSVSVHSPLLFDIPVAPNETFDLALILYAASIASSSPAPGDPSVMANQFLSTMEITSVEARNDSGLVSVLFTQAASNPTPEPAPMLLIATGLTGVFVARRRVRKLH